MKKKIALLGLCAVFGLGVAVATPICIAEQSQNHIVAVYAAEEGEEETTETTETEQPVVVEEQPKDEVKEWFDKFFSPQMIAMYISWLAYIGTIIGLVANIKKLKNQNQLTLENVVKAISKLLEDLISKEVAKQFEKIAPKLIDGQEKGNQIMSIFAKILALSQENTPESKVAILNLIEELGVVGKEITQTAKEVVIESKELAEQAKEELNHKIDEIVESYDGTSI